MDKDLFAGGREICGRGKRKHNSNTDTNRIWKRRRRLRRDVGNDQMVVLVCIHIINKCYFVATTPNNGNDN